MIDKIKELMKEEWKITVEDIGDGPQSYAQRGDFNCPHRKEYDPADGHGTSQVWAEGFDHEDPSKTLEESIEKLYNKCKAVIPGQLWPEKDDNENNNV